MKKNTLLQFTSIHFVGIKGIAMTALALWAKGAGIRVTGSDTSERFPSDVLLASHNIPVFTGFSRTHITELNPRPELIIYTGAHNGLENCEVQEARSLRIPVMAHGVALGEAMKNKRQISVAGSHGKTTTSSMVASIFSQALLDPSYAIGCGEIAGLGDPGHFGTGEMFIAEADEYITDPHHDRTPRFLWQHPEYLVVTNIDFDHPDAYESLQSVQEAFVSLQDQLTGNRVTVMNADNPESSVLLRKGAHVLTYGSRSTARYMFHSIRTSEGKTIFSVDFSGTILGEITLHVPGIHNVYNATAATAVAHEFGIPWKAITLGLSQFGGAKRRFELLGEAKKYRLYDDYAHHPKEISATINAVKGWFPTYEIVVVFQPHTYSRTARLLPQFATAFSEATTTILTDIYASAREKNSHTISGETLFAAVKKNSKNVMYCQGKNDVLKSLLEIKKEGQIVIFMGAGDIYTWEREMVSHLIQ